MNGYDFLTIFISLLVVAVIGCLIYLIYVIVKHYKKKDGTDPKKLGGEGDDGSGPSPAPGPAPGPSPPYSPPPHKGPTCQNEIGADCYNAPCCAGLQCIGGSCLKCADGPESPAVMQTCNVCASMNIPVEAGGDPQDFAACDKCGNCKGVYYDIQM
jgi:hypothetical protein